MAREAGAVLPVVEEVLHDYEQLIAAGHGDEDISAIFRVKTALFGGRRELTPMTGAAATPASGTRLNLPTSARRARCWPSRSSSS